MKLPVKNRNYVNSVIFNYRQQAEAREVNPNYTKQKIEVW